MIAVAAADVAIVCVGTSAETETEGRDRTTLALPGRQAELVRRVAAVNEPHRRRGQRRVAGRHGVGG